MGGWKRTKPTVYAVYWPQISVLKVGCSERQRWRRFALRGAAIVGLVEFDSASEAYDFEALCDGYLDALFKPGFATPIAAEPFLGVRGDGYRECYAIPRFLTAKSLSGIAQALLKHCSSIAQVAAKPVPEPCSSNAHTYRQTYKHQLTLGNYPTLGNARRGAERFHPIEVSNA